MRRGYPSGVLAYELTVADLAAFAAWQARQSGEHDRRGHRLAVLSAWLVGIAAYLVVSAAATIPLLLGRSWTLAAAGELLAVACGVALALAEWRSARVAEYLLARPYRRRAREALARTGAERRVWLDAEGLNVAVSNRTEHVAWARIAQLVETDDHVFVQVDTNAAHVIPHRAGPQLATVVSGIRAGLRGRG